jgi:hypothetical protein
MLYQRVILKKISEIGGFVIPQLHWLKPTPAAQIIGQRPIWKLSVIAGSWLSDKTSKKSVVMYIYNKIGLSPDNYVLSHYSHHGGLGSNPSLSQQYCLNGMHKRANVVLQEICNSK